MRQLSNRQSYTKAKDGLLPHSCYDNSFTGEGVTILNPNERDETSDVDGYSSEEEEVDITNDNDEISATFVLGRTSRFGRAIRYNRRFVDF